MIITDNRIFIIAQGRSGSTLLWNIFRHLPKFTTFYEPLHPTLLSNIKDGFGPHGRSRHWKVTEYWEEYRQVPELEKYYKSLEESSLEEKFDYFDKLSESTDKISVYKILRLWGHIKELRIRYPDANIIHLWRDVDTQFNSFIHGGFEIEPGRIALDYFGEWRLGYELQYPNTHVPEQLNGDEVLKYYKGIWELAREEGLQYSNLSLHYESILIRPDRELKPMLEMFDCEEHLDDAVNLVVKPPKYPI